MEAGMIFFATRFAKKMSVAPFSTKFEKPRI